MTARLLRRVLDVVSSISGLLILAPLFVLVALLIRLEGGPVFFVQERIGRGLVPFKMYKFRTMALRADGGGRCVTVEGDSRITRIGGLLRKYKIDELPQLLNVLKGDMSLVGPRPEVPRYVQLFPEEYGKLLQISPGITDPASLRYAKEEHLLAQSPDPEEAYVSRILPDKIRLSLQYAENRTLRSDLQVIAETIFKISGSKAR